MIPKMLRAAKLIESISIFMYHLQCVWDVSFSRVKGALLGEASALPVEILRALSVLTSRVKDCPQNGRGYIAMTACDV